MMLKIASRPDWNSDVDIAAGRLNSYRGQLGAYQRRSGAVAHYMVSWRQ